MNTCTPEATFTLDPAGQVSSVPASVQNRIFGKQTPINPHAQRLLVAASKPAKPAEPKNPAKVTKTSTKTKAKDSKAAKAKDSKAAKAKESKAAKVKDSKAKTSKEKTPYALAKDAYMLMLLDHFCMVVHQKTL